MKAVGYIRVSTEEQAREGYGLSAQEQAVRSYCKAQSWDLTEIYSDAGRSGKAPIMGAHRCHGVLTQHHPAVDAGVVGQKSSQSVVSGLVE